MAFSRSSATNGLLAPGSAPRRNVPAPLASRTSARPPSSTLSAARSASMAPVMSRSFSVPFNSQTLPAASSTRDVRDSVFSGGGSCSQAKTPMTNVTISR